MALSKSSVLTNSNLSDDILHKVIISQDLSGLSKIEQIDYLKNLSIACGLNPITKPFELMEQKGKLIPYIRKDGTEQLRFNHKVSTNKLETQLINDAYVVTAYVSLPNGRTDTSTGVVSIKGLYGESLSNAMMKAETKAKRRATLSICGLGMIDESEVDSIPNAKVIQVHKNEKKIDFDAVEVKPVEFDTDEIILSVERAEDMPALESIFLNAKSKIYASKDSAALKRLVEAKDKRKVQLTSQETQDWIDDYNQETGEVK